MTTVLVTGANGFIGSHLVRALLDRGYEVRGLVRHTSDLSSLRGLPVQLYVGDVTEPDTLRAAVRGVDYIYHLAAALLPTDPDRFFAVNTEGTVNVMETATELAPELKRFLFASSQAAAGPAPGPVPLTEVDPARPISAYGASKREAEERVLAYAGRFPVTIVRPSSVYGERERDISRTFPAVEGGLLPVLGEEEKVVVMVYVKDLVAGMVAAAESAAAKGKVYFLNHPERLTGLEVPEAIAAAMGKEGGREVRVPLALVHLIAPLAAWQARLSRQRPAMTPDKARELAQPYWLADPGRAQRDFGWEATRSLAEGMVPTVAAYRAEQAAVREMALEKPGVLWGKYVLSGSAVGVLIEILSAVGGFYTFQPAWAVLVAIFGGFGAALGTVAMLLRRRGAAVQFLAGSAVMGGAEYLNEKGKMPVIGWTFKPGWPLGIRRPMMRVFVLAGAGGIVVLLVNGMMRALYRRRLRLG